MGMLGNLEKLSTDERFIRFLTKLREFAREHKLELFHRDIDEEFVYEFMLVSYINGHIHDTVFVVHFEDYDSVEDVDKTFDDLMKRYTLRLKEWEEVEC